MVTLQICGIPVEFPFQPYDSQLIYMEKVLLSLTSKQNAILESPTGTGKTLCLLCATLAWRRHVKKTMTAHGSVARNADNGLAYEGWTGQQAGGDEEDAEEVDERIPRIIYSSRTHSQLKQVVKELKNTAYRPRVAVLGSREHLCVNDKVSKLKGTRQNLACRSEVKNRKCSYKQGFDVIKGRNKKVDLPIMDIEELVEHMRAKQVCPFFLSRTVLAEAEILFVPYNYLIDPMARQSIGIPIENSVLVFDEAHNVESLASDAASFALSSNDISGCVAEVQQFVHALNENRIMLTPQSSVSAESAETLKALLLEIDKGLHAFPLSSSGGFTKPGEFIFEFFQQFNVNFETCPLVLSMVEEIIELANQGSDQRTAASRLDALLSFLSTIFRNKEKHMSIAKNYRVHIQEVQDRGTPNAPRLFNSMRNGKTIRVFNYWCFHPGVSFEEIATHKIHNVILTSGTLSPLETTIKELGVEFPVRLENNHVIDANQVWVGVVGTGVTGKRLNSSYNYRSTDEYLIELGNTIVNFARLVPNGLLVFFPSYGILEQSIERWRRPSSSDSATSVWDRLLQLKEVYVEPRSRVEFKTVVDEYNESIVNTSTGALFFAVCRGKVSEGIDFSNEKGRAVVITGLPFPPTKDPKIVLKKSILDEANVEPGKMKLTGNHWYVQQAARAVNQAIGRVIRHRHDYGAIILCDERFGSQQQLNCLSKWLQPYCRTHRRYGEAHIGLMRFFKANNTNTVAAVSVKKIESDTAPQPTAKNVAVFDPSNNPDQTRRNSVKIGSSQIAMGDGQSYVNPLLLNQRPMLSKASQYTSSDVEQKPTNSGPLPSAPDSHPHARKRTLGSFLSSTGSTMTQATSSILRPFAPPKSRLSSADNSLTSPMGKNPAIHGEAATSSDPVSSFPTVARRVLSGPEVANLYALIRKLHDGDDVDTSLATLCDILRASSKQELLDLMPMVLTPSIRSRFVGAATRLGLHINISSDESGYPPVYARSNSSATSSSSGMASFFEKLQQNKRRRQNNDQRPATVVQDPQCVVCYEMTRKAYASNCGHICCLPCWQKMEKDGFTTCPMCKVPFHLNQLSLIRAAKPLRANSSKSADGDISISMDKSGSVGHSTSPGAI